MKIRIVLRVAFFIGFTFYAVASADSSKQESKVENNVFISPDNPKVHVEVDKKLKYIGKVPFQIDKIAGGFRYIFVDAKPDKHIQSMFIIQQEGFFPSSDDTYKYRITSPAKLGNFEYQHNVFFFDMDKDIAEDPGKESDVTKRFLQSQGYTLEPELAVSRFARSVDLEHKHEIIFFCYENLSSYGHKLTDFPEDADSDEKEAVKKKVDQNCYKVFKVKDLGTLTAKTQR